MDFVRAFLDANTLPGVSSRLEGLALVRGTPSREAKVTLILDTQEPSCVPKMERRLLALMRPLGLIAEIVWFDRGDPYSDWAETQLALLRTPWVWMGLASSAALVALAGWRGLFWTAFWGTSAWFLAKGLSLLLRRRFPIQARGERR